jgi:hypothetical protein
MALRFDRNSLYNVTKVETISGRPLEVTSTSTAPTTVQYTDVAKDAFGRLRTSDPFTLFDSSHRYSDNGQWVESTTAGGSSSMNSDEGSIDMTVTTASGAQVLRETKRVFNYQPGKSLLSILSFNFNETKTNLKQRIGYYGASNGLYLEVNGTNEPVFVKRSAVTGSVVDTEISQSNWNVDTLDGNGPSGITLNLSKVQILWFDFEWLGAGTVRCGFIINGEYIHCHSFQHANTVEGTYITTATLPIRAEIINTDTTASNSTLKQICATILSEGGYQLHGQSAEAKLPISSPRDLTVVSTTYPIISIRLKSNRLDGVVILDSLNVLGTTNNANYCWEIVQGGSTTGGSWVSPDTSSLVEYNITATGYSLGDGETITAGYAVGSNQGSTVSVLDRANLFEFQLERNSFTSTPYELVLVASTDNAGADVLASLGWQETTR